MREVGGARWDSCWNLPEGKFLLTLTSHFSFLTSHLRRLKFSFSPGLLSPVASPQSPAFACSCLLSPVSCIPKTFLLKSLRVFLFSYAVKFSRCMLRCGMCEVGSEILVGICLFGKFLLTLTSHFSCLTSHLVGLGGLEPPTSRLSGVRSSRLSYKPIILDVGGGMLEVRTSHF